MSYIVPIGPYHPSLEEPVHAKLYTEGEVIKDAEVFVGYNHRGIEKLATERNAIQTLVLVERVCGTCSHSHAFTYAMSVEDLNGIEVPKRYGSAGGTDRQPCQLCHVHHRRCTAGHFR